MFLLAAQFPGQSQHEVLARTVEAAVVAEEAGFDDVWIAEHHFMTYGVCPSATTLAAYVLGRTRRIAVGTAVSVLSTRHPVALAEEAALLDQVSNGRFRLGVGRGGPWIDLDIFETGLHRYTTTFPTDLDRLLTALQGTPIHPTPAPGAPGQGVPGQGVPGQDVPGQEVRIVPGVLTGPPIVVACTSAGTADLAARRGLPMLLGMHAGNEDKRILLDRYAITAENSPPPSTATPSASAPTSFDRTAEAVPPPRDPARPHVPGDAPPRPLGPDVPHVPGDTPPLPLGSEVPRVPGNAVPRVLGPEVPYVPGDATPPSRGPVEPYVPGSAVPRPPGSEVPRVPGSAVPRLLGSEVPYVPGNLPPREVPHGAADAAPPSRGPVEPYEPGSAAPRPPGPGVPRVPGDAPPPQGTAGQHVAADAVRPSVSQGPADVAASRGPAVPHGTGDAVPLSIGSTVAHGVAGVVPALLGSAWPHVVDGGLSVGRGVGHVAVAVAYVADTRGEAQGVLRAALPRWLGPGLAGYRAIGGSRRVRDVGEYVDFLCRIHPVGSADDCVAGLAETAEYTGLEHFILMVEGPGDPARVHENIRRLGAEVLPRLRARRAG